MTTPTAQRSIDGRTELLTLIGAGVTKLVREWRRLSQAQNALLHDLAQLIPGTGATQRIRSSVQVFNGQVGEFDRAARAFAERWAAVDLPIAYRDGALRALDRARRDVTLFRWTADHQAAVTGLTATFYADLMGRIQEAVRRAQAFLRAAQEAVRTQQGVDTARLEADHPLSTVVYADQTRMPVEAWARSALAWQGAVTANNGAINVARLELGAEWLECTDGTECGFLSHQDTDHASGTIRSVDDAAAYPVAHPGCIRQWAPRPDLNGTPNLESGDPA